MFSIEDITLMMVAILLFVTLIVAYIRIKDTPAATLKEMGWKGILEIYIGCLIAGFVIMWVQAEAGVMIDTIQGFLLVGAGAYGGVGAAKAAFNIVTKVTASAA